MARNKPWSFVCDVDGVLTDGKFAYSDQGKVLKTFGSHDAEALKGSSLFSSISFITADERGFEISATRVRDMGPAPSIVTLGWKKSRVNALSKVMYSLLPYDNSFE